MYSAIHDIRTNLSFFTFSLQPLPGGTMHSYIFPGAVWEAHTHWGAVMDGVPFTHPAHVPAILNLLRHQCVINTLLRSCMASQCASPSRGSLTLQNHRHCGGSHVCKVMWGLTDAPVSSGSACDLHFEVLLESDTSFSVTFQQPNTDSLAVCEYFPLNVFTQI